MNCAKIAICFASSTALAVMMQPAAAAQKAAEPVKSVRLYMFDCGTIKGFDATFFSLKKEEIAGTTDMVVPCYLVAHPKGTLMWDVGVIPDSVFKGGNRPSANRC